MQNNKTYIVSLIAAHALTLAGAAQGAQTCDTSITPSAPTDRFNGALRDGTVDDNGTGLTWKKCSEGQTYNLDSNTCSGTAATYDWQGALQQAQAVNRQQDSAGKAVGFAGHTDWRVPNIKELRSLVEQSCQDPAIDPTNKLFPLTPSGWYWSSSPFVRNTGDAWGVDFTDGSATSQPMTTQGYLRLVRGGL